MLVSNSAGRIIEMTREEFDKYGRQMGMKIALDVYKDKFTTPVDKEVEVVIVKYNNPKVEEKCIEDVKLNTIHPYRLRVFDNYGTGLSLTEVWNKCIKESKCEYVCLLNSDAYVTEGWLQEMMKGFNNKDVAAIGPSSDKVCAPQNLLDNPSKTRGHKGEFEEVQFLSGFCMVLKKGITDFEESVPFYGNESVWCVKARRLGYKLMWSRGSFVYHDHGSTAKKEGVWNKLRDNGVSDFAKWVADTTPVLFTTYNRLEYTKKALKALRASNCGKIYVIDNNSTDGTQKWLQSLSGTDSDIEVIYNKENIGVAGVMNQFFEMTPNEEFIAKVDNDTIVEKDWLEKLVYAAHYCPVDILQAKHHIWNPKGQSFNEWIAGNPRSKRVEDVVFTNFVGGSGVVIRRKAVSKIEKSDWVLGGWTKWQTSHPEVKKGFHCGVNIELLDMEDDNVLNPGDYEEYYEETGRKAKKENRYLGAFKTIEEITDRLGERFAYLRFGDAEIRMMVDDFGGHEWTQWNSPELMKELEEAFKIDDKNYLIAPSGGLVKEEKAEDGLFAPFDIDGFLKEINDRYHSNHTFYSTIPFHYLYIFYPELFNAYFKMMTKNYKVALVGGPHLKPIKSILGLNDHIQTPEQQAYDTIDKWFPRVVQAAKDNDILLICLSMTAEPVQKRLWNKRIKVGTIDFGSVGSALIGYKGNKKHRWIQRGYQKTGKSL